MMSTTTATKMNFAPLDERMQWYVDQQILSCVATVVLDGSNVVHTARHGYMSVHDQRPLLDDGIFRMYSNTKLLTSIALMMLYENGEVALDDPLAEYLPEFSTMRVLRSNASNETATEPLNRPISIRHILSHSGGITYGEGNHPVDQMYKLHKVNRNKGETLTTFLEKLGKVPLRYEPGQRWLYSLSTDVCGGLVEAISGQPFDEYLQQKQGEKTRTAG
jgi:CubicO group peptidase (beta-lactamase class C family)